MDFSNLKSTILKKYSEDMNFFSSIDFRSSIEKPNYFSFKTSQNLFKAIKSNQDINVLSERISSGKMAVLVMIEEVKLESFIINQIEIVQDIELKEDTLLYQSGNYTLTPEFNTKNALNQKEIIIYDIRIHQGTFTCKFKTKSGNIIEAVSKRS